MSAEVGILGLPGGVARAQVGDSVVERSDMNRRHGCVFRSQFVGLL